MKKGTKKKGKFTKQPKYWVSTVTCSSAVCQVQGCTNRRLNCDNSINFHRLAGNAPDELLKAWSQFCFGVSYKLHCDLEVSSKRPIVVCSLHFEEGAFVNNRPDYESQAYLQLKSDAIPTVKQSEVIGEVVQQGTLVAPEYISRDDETQETFYREDTGEYFVVQRVEGMDLQQEDEGTEYILSDDTDTLVVEGCSQEEEILIDEDNLYVLQEEGDELMEAYDDSIPPLLTFDGRLVSFMEEVLEVICNHMTACEKLEQENLALEEETKRLTERNGQLASTLRRMRSEMNEVYKCFSPIFTPGQMDRIRGRKDPWQKKDFERAMKLKILGPAAYKYLRKHYKFPLPSLRLLEIYESSCSSELEPLYKNMQAFQDIVQGAFINNGPDYESQAYLQLKSDAIPTVKQSEVIGEVVQQGTLVAPEYISRDDETQETFYREDTGEYFVVQRVEGMDLQQEDEGTEYILSDDTDTLVVEGCSQEEEILIDEDNLYVLQDEGDELMEAYDDSIPPLLTFDGRLVSFMEEVREGKEDVKSGIETKRLTERNGQLASTLRRMRSEMNEVYKCFSPIFTPGQMDRIRGRKDPWQKKDFERAMKLKILGPMAYKYLRKHYKFPLPSLRLLEIYESSCSSELEPLYKNMQAFQDIVRQRKCDKTNLKFRKSIHVDSMIIITTKPLK
uniref:THAP-type domain-containing protein n=1 Tax=Lutzomyia longipalpis TaxID=7200 RepID=A0A1B0GKY4_LUTLO